MKANKKLKGLLIFCFFLIFISAFYFLNQTAVFETPSLEKEEEKFVKIKDKILKVEIADSPTLRLQGLSGRENLAEDSGMLFIFETSGKYGFWMRAMNFPIDILWLGEDFQVVSIKEKAEPDSFPEIFTPKEEAKYVLEVVSGFSAKNNILVGEKVEFLFLNTP